MEKINKKILSLILDCSVEDARKKILVALGEDGKTGDDNPEISPSLLEEKTGMPILTALKSISENFLSNMSTRQWILDYPLSKMKPDKYGKIQKKIHFPYNFKKLVPEAIRREIVSYWARMYPEYIENGGTFVC